MRYDLDDLRHFPHIVAEGSIAAGARRMHLSLPSASDVDVTVSESRPPQTVRMLADGEADLGVRHAALSGATSQQTCRTQ